ncbi:MAG: molybdopterin molybdotransferase MoeA [Candidatus Lokiarchaeota archaeon]|nr:molybdopterin molybdotransferase MoeA [Candidatus Lokiarchaeota archaeon]
MKFLNTVSYKELRNILENISFNTSEEEIISIDKSLNRVISKDIYSKINVPHFKKSRMDGYAVIAEDIFDAEEDNVITLELIEIIDAGTIPLKRIEKGKCAYVATGAAIPEGANAVIMVEFTIRENNKILISKAITPGTYIVNIGADIKEKQKICDKGHLINISTLGVLSSCGIEKIPVFKKIKVGLISTGNEIVPITRKDLNIGEIYDVNSIVLKNAMLNTGVDVKFYGIVKDNLSDLKDIILKTLTERDIIIVSGGTSKGEGDLGPLVLKELQNIELLIHGVKIKPGKPFIFAQMKNKIIFILPGYPTSALSCFYLIIENFLKKASRLPLKEKDSKRLEIGERIYSTIGRYEFKPVLIKKIEGKKKIFPINTGSEAISTMYNANGYIVIEELESIVEKGEFRNFYKF